MFKCNKIFIGCQMVLTIGDAIIHESTNQLIEKLCDDYDEIQSKINYVKALNDNVNLDKLTWVEYKMNKDYEISNEYPHYIKRKYGNKIMRMRYKEGYVLVDLNGKPQLHHQLIGTQFIPNPNNYNEIDHQNQNGVDNRIENLLWVSRSENNKNRSSTRDVEYTFVDNIPDDSVELTKYKEFEFQKYFISPGEKKAYYFNGSRYRILESRRSNCVNISDTNHKNHQFSINCLIKSLQH